MALNCIFIIEISIGRKYKRIGVCRLWVTWSYTGRGNLSSTWPRRRFWGCYLEGKTISQICRSCACPYVLWHTHDQCGKTQRSFGILQSLRSNLFTKSYLNIRSFKANRVLQSSRKEVRANTWSCSASRTSFHSRSGNPFNYSIVNYINSYDLFLETNNTKKVCLN